MTTREWLLGELARMGDVRTDRLHSIQEQIDRLVLLIAHLDNVGYPEDPPKESPGCGDDR
jgi:hypothetical protein